MEEARAENAPQITAETPELPADLNPDGVRAALAGQRVKVKFGDGEREVDLVELLSYVRCRPGRPANGCQGRGFSLRTVPGQRSADLQPCGCTKEAWRKAQAPRQMPALTEEQTAKRGEPRRIPKGAHDRLAQLKRELAKEHAKLTAMREKVGAAIAGIADELSALTAEEAQNKRDTAAAEGTVRVAGAQLEELRARLAGLVAQVDEAKAAGERLQAVASQFGARRMQAEARLAEERKRLAPTEKNSADRIESLEYRLRQHLARWPELAEVAPS